MFLYKFAFALGKQDPMATNPTNFDDISRENKNRSTNVFKVS